jgi:VWFA-related protein
LLALLLLAGPVLSQQSEPVDVNIREDVDVRLVILDIVALDDQGRTIPDLTKDDFEIIAGGKIVPVDTLDVDCPAERAKDPRGVKHARLREPAVAPEKGRRIALAFDYLHLQRGRRFEVLEQAIDMVRHGSGEHDEVMVAALNGGLRIEQRFSADRGEVIASLRRMQYDISLWQPDFYHVNEFGFLDGVTALLDFLGSVPGPKAIVFFSEMADVPLDSQFKKIAAVATSSRCSFYPVDVAGLRMAESPELPLDVARRRKTESMELPLPPGGG